MYVIAKNYYETPGKNQFNTDEYDYLDVPSDH